MKLITAAAFGLGYIVGTKAGRERYDQIRQLAQTASKNFDVSEVLQRLETYRARLEAHSSGAGRERA